MKLEEDLYGTDSIRLCRTLNNLGKTRHYQCKNIKSNVYYFRSLELDQTSGKIEQIQVKKQHKQDIFFTPSDKTSTGVVRIRSAKPSNTLSRPTRYSDKTPNCTIPWIWLWVHVHWRIRVVGTSKKPHIAISECSRITRLTILSAFLKCFEPCVLTSKESIWTVLFLN